jgi:hypothetical protein
MTAILRTSELDWLELSGLEKFAFSLFCCAVYRERLRKATEASKHVIDLSAL